MPDRDRWAQLTCGFRRNSRDPECGERPQWRLASPLRPDWDPGRSPLVQQYACDGHLERFVAWYGEHGTEVLFEPLDERTVPGSPLVESRRPEQPLSERDLWLLARTAGLVAQHMTRGDAYMQAAHEWFAGHGKGESCDA